ncbi:MBL fold metallo-hydrolase [Streptomyces sp. AK02-01A]|uniref:MBL fold metallo-hydrolase n=1 Tax=Streptomyces sp. AK02-01A TaxID=3028648 RepID=UPI0029AFCCC9|nr:MBL fold metallo-hydrolase [Streptomyces sp. AK02-01A]MDX3853451.1 MBL fold metallo-hydrolase [Streptomyces sp. AK02-01A]
MTDNQHKKFGEPTDRYGIGAAGMPLNTLADYRPIPADSYGSLFLPDRLTKGYHVEEMNDGVYYVTSGAYDAMFVVTGSGVVVVDAPPLLGTNMLRAIKEVTDAPVTHLIYSHWHSDHIGAAGIFGPDVKVISHEYTREMIQRWPDLGGERGLPVPTETFSTNETLEVGGVKLQLDYKGVNHTPGNIFIYAPKQKVLAAIDIISPGWSAFKHCDASENIRGWAEAHDWILDYDFKAVVSGHVNRWGTREDAVASRAYTNDIVDFAKEALDQAEDLEFIQRNGFSNAWVLWENYFNEMTNYVTKKTLEKVTDNGQNWGERLAGADVMTKYHAYSILEALRLEYGMVTGFEKRIIPQDS